MARIAAVVMAFDEARLRHQKYEAAVQAAIEAVRAFNPRMPISKSEVTRVLADYRNKNSAEVYLFREAREHERSICQPEEIIRIYEHPFGEKSRIIIVSSGPIPIYPRVNARAQGTREGFSETSTRGVRSVSIASSEG